MQSTRVLVWLCAICMLSVQVAYAQNGAVVVRGQDLAGFSEYDGNGLLAVMSSDSELFCSDDGDLMFYDWAGVIRPDGSINYHDRGHFFTRVFFTTPEAFWDDPCAGWNNYDLMVAEGITQSVFHDNDLFGDRMIAGKPNARNSAGYSIAGGLYDLAGLCEGDIVELNIVVRWLIKKDFPACQPDCFFKLVLKGPRLNCP